MGWSCRLVFERRSALWYAEISDGIPVAHVLKAYQWIEAVYGGSHVTRSEPEQIRPTPLGTTGEQTNG